VTKLGTIIRQEFKVAAANKTFIILTIIGPFLILAITVLPGLLSMNPKVSSGGGPVAVSGGDAAVQSALEAAIGTQGRKLVRLGEDDASRTQAKLDVGKGGLDALVVLDGDWMDQGGTIYTKTGTDAILFSLVEQSLGAVAREARIAKSGIDPALARELAREVKLSIVGVGKDASEKKGIEDAFMTTLFTAMGFVMLIYMTTILYGQLIGRSVVQEKVSKTVEVMLSSVSSRELMIGKILGLGLAGLLQYGVWAGMALVLSKLLAPALGIAAPAAVSLGNIAWLVVFFVLAFFLYAAGYAAIGAAAEDESHLGQLAWPLLIFLIIPLVMISSFVMNPNSTLSVLLSLFPMTSPIVMLIRVLVSPPPLWQLALCLGLLAATIYAMMAAAAKIFRVGILMTGKRTTLKEMMRWISAA